MPDIAKKAVLDLAQKKFYVDGEEFPWFIDVDGPTLNNLCSPDTLRSVTLTFFVEDVEVVPEEAASSDEGAGKYATGGRIEAPAGMGSPIKADVSPCLLIPAHVAAKYCDELAELNDLPPGEPDGAQP